MQSKMHKIRYVRKWEEKRMEARDMDDWKFVKKMLLGMEDFYWKGPLSVEILEWEGTMI